MKNIKEGSLYKKIRVENTTFHIYYGYYSEQERERWEPSPIFPDFKKTPMFTGGGLPFARADQDVCQHYTPKESVSGEEWCNDCTHFQLEEELIGVCRNDHRKDNVRKDE